MHMLAMLEHRFYYAEGTMAMTMPTPSASCVQTYLESGERRWVVGTATKSASNPFASSHNLRLALLDEHHIFGSKGAFLPAHSDLASAALWACINWGEERRHPFLRLLLLLSPINILPLPIFLSTPQHSPFADFHHLCPLISQPPRPF